jgi:hypothetical protein
MGRHDSSHPDIKGQHSNIVDVQYFRGADCDSDPNLVVANIRETLSVRKQAMQKFDMDRFNLKKLSDVEVNKPYQVKISNRFAALKNFSDGVDIYRVWENIRI